MCKEAELINEYTKELAKIVKQRKMMETYQKFKQVANDSYSQIQITPSGLKDIDKGITQ